MSRMEDAVKLSGGEIIAVDGKTQRRSHDRKRGLKALHMVSAWASRNGVVLGQVKTEENSNEITAIPVLLEKLELSGSIVTSEQVAEIGEWIIECESGEELLSRVERLSASASFTTGNTASRQ